MTLTQLEYIIALDTYRNFVTAAEHCFVTQPTLSMQIQKFEDELGVKIFDRSKQPVLPTGIGEQIITQARLVVKEQNRIIEMVENEKGVVQGTLRIGVIPTVAPYLIPRFLIPFLKKFPAVNIEIDELTTDQILSKLKSDQLDCGIMAGPIDDDSMNKEVLYFEEFVAYVSKSNKLFKKTTIKPEDLDLSEVWILHEGHCLRNQVLNLCKDRKSGSEQTRLIYQTGTVETLMRIVEQGDGLTILPELAIADFKNKQLNMVRYFREPEPVREICMVTHRNYVKRKLIKSLSEEIMQSVPAKLQKKNRRKVVPIAV